MTAVARWRAGLGDELAYWRLVMETKGLEWPDDFRERLDPATPLQEHVRALLPRDGDVRILDVGAGPFTILGKVWPGRRVTITAIDPLALSYEQLVSEHGFVGPVTRLQANGEDVAQIFGPNSFDLAYARNSLDHAYDPVAAIEAMLVVAPVVHLEHSSREATKQGHAGLHQWDIFAEGEHLFVDGDGRLVDVTERLGVTSAVEERGGWVVATFRRDAARGSSPVPPRGPSSQ